MDVAHAPNSTVGTIRQSPITCLGYLVENPPPSPVPRSPSERSSLQTHRAPRLRCVAYSALRNVV